jgi:hypothetical protein
MHLYRKHTGKNTLSVTASPHDPAYEVFEHKPEITMPVSVNLPADHSWTFPEASVSALDLKVKAP